MCTNPSGIANSVEISFLPLHLLCYLFDINKSNISFNNSCNATIALQPMERATSPIHRRGSLDQADGAVQIATITYKWPDRWCQSGGRRTITNSSI